MPNQVWTVAAVLLEIKGHKVTSVIECSGCVS